MEAAALLAGRPPTILPHGPTAAAVEMLHTVATPAPHGNDAGADGLWTVAVVAITAVAATAVAAAIAARLRLARRELVEEGSGSRKYLAVDASLTDAFAEPSAGRPLASRRRGFGDWSCMDVDPGDIDAEPSSSPSPSLARLGASFEFTADGEQSSPGFQPLQLLGRVAAAARAKVGDVADRLLQPRSDEGESRPLYGDSDEEEMQGLLSNEQQGSLLVTRPAPARRQAARRQATSPAQRPQSAARRPHRATATGADTGQEDDDEEAVAALMKLRPAARDSIGDCEEDEQPLIASERMNSLHR